MPDDVVEAVSEAMTDLDARAGDPEAIDNIYTLLAKRIHGPAKVRPVGVEDLKAVLSASFGAERAEQVVTHITENRRTRRPFVALEAFPISAIAAVLKAESSAVAGLVLSNVDPAIAADVLASYEPEQAAPIVKRMATSNAPSARVLTSLADELTARVQAAVSAGSQPTPSERLRSIAKVLNFSTPQIEANVIKSIAEDDEAMASELREYMFTWDNIATVDKRNMQKILGTVDTKTLSISLKASTPEIEANVMGNLSERVREMVKEEREMAGPMSMADVQAARDEIMKNVRAMIESGEFTPARSGEDLVA
jgi:flagellar motor switch protein FliG